MGKKLILLIILLCSMVVNVEAQVTPAIKQKGNNVGPPGLSNIGVLPCVATAADPVYIEGNEVNCSVRLNGTMRVDTAGGGGGGTSSTFGAAFPATGTASGWSDGTNMQGARVFDLDTGVGTQYVAGSALRCSGAGGSTECLPATAVDADGIANQTSTYLHGMGYMYNGATWDRIRGTIASGLLVSISNATLAVTQSGAWTVAVSNAFLLDATFTGRFVAATLDADALANETTTAVHGKCYLYNGATWDRCRGSIANGLTVSVSNATLAVTQSGTWNINNISGTISLPTGAATEATLATRLADATFTGRFVAATLDADAIANQTTTSVHGMGYMYNGATWDRIRGAIATGLLVNVSNASLAVTGTFFQATQPVSIAGTVSIQGVKSNNAVVPGANNNGTLPCVATAAAPAYTDTFQVACSITLTGDTRVISKTVTLSTTGQQAVTAVATALPANSGREVCIKVVSSGTQTVFYGIAGVTTATGQELLPGEKFCAPISNSSQFVVIAGGAGSTVAFEVYN